MDSGDPVKIPSKEKLKSQRQKNKTPVGDLFAPFFDVVFYSPTEEVGEAEKLENEGRVSDSVENEAKRAKAAKLRAATEEKQRSALGDTTLIGSSRIELRSAGGGFQSFSPQGLDTAVGQLSFYRSNLQVSMVSAAALQATLTLTPPYQDAIDIVDNKLIT
jgi:hypothetical protein